MDYASQLFAQSTDERPIDQIDPDASGSAM
jgi:hypothetical protein